MSTLDLNILRLCFLFSILQLTVTTVAGENVPPAARVAAAIHGHVLPRTNLNRNLHIRDVQTCYTNKQCTTANDELIAPCLPKGDTQQTDSEILECICNATKKYSNYWTEYEQCETCRQKEEGTEDSGIDFSKEGPKVCESFQGGETTTTPDTPSTPAPTATTDDVIVTGTAEETTTTETTEETPTPETAGNQTTTTETTKKSPTTELTVVNESTTLTTLTTVDKTPEATVSRGNTSTTRTGLPTPTKETNNPDDTDTDSGAAGSITTAQHGFQTAVWAFGIKLVIVAAFNFIL